ncbi:hypothetical protein M409DRAFT_54523 [Zasmidium cellare ATCC 36951]|uniref:Uncharacterized protein n=1 Tax=Zasmidium cellare ATCC 36951 TaxID=1080233 RepID=A0A6A6CLB7_ZASCE|nr:uncharacterized protein M409DRAFT_54523 [Zasmidium cellare ATCC 36951]KAF2166732.1 hypothetical protein M409DRAFT_54523 [Zasmidium cellare ATCC 36951]
MSRHRERDGFVGRFGVWMLRGYVHGRECEDEDGDEDVLPSLSCENVGMTVPRGDEDIHSAIAPSPFTTTNEREREKHERRPKETESKHPATALPASGKRAHDTDSLHPKIPRLRNSEKRREEGNRKVSTRPMMQGKEFDTCTVYMYRKFVDEEQDVPVVLAVGTHRFHGSLVRRRGDLQKPWNSTSRADGWKRMLCKVETPSLSVGGKSSRSVMVMYCRLEASKM